MARQTRPAIIKITPMALMSTYAEFQVIAQRRIAPMAISAMLPPMVMPASSACVGHRLAAAGPDTRTAQASLFIACPTRASRRHMARPDGLISRLRRVPR